MNEERTVRIAVAGLSDAMRQLAERGQAARPPAAEWLYARGRVVPADAMRWRDWLLADSGLGADVLTRFPAGPCIRAPGAETSADATWACAEPVHLLAAIDHLQLAAPAPLRLHGEESAELLESLDGQLAGSGFSLEATAQGGWVCRGPPGLECVAAEPAAALGRNLRDFLPGGRDAARVRALVNELQMLLHEHRVNERRRRRNEPEVNSLWLWGFGTRAAPAATAEGVLLSDDPWLTGLWQLHGGCALPVSELSHVLREVPALVRVALSPATRTSDLQAELQSLELDVLAPVRAALLAGVRRRVELHAGPWTVTVPSSARWKFWRSARPLAEVGR